MGGVVPARQRSDRRCAVVTALSDALVAAQRRALAATQKAYVAGHLDRDDAVAELNTYGLTDDVDIGYLLAACDVIRARGAALPAEQGEAQAAKDDPATDAQRARVKRDVAKLHGDDAAASIAGEHSLTKAQASEIIDSIAKGTFELERWYVPF